MEKGIDASEGGLAAGKLYTHTMTLYKSPNLKT